MGTSTQWPVFYPLEEGRKSKGKNSLRDWVRNKDQVAPCSRVARISGIEGEMGAALGLGVLKGTWPP